MSYRDTIKYHSLIAKHIDPKAWFVWMFVVCVLFVAFCVPFHWWRDKVEPHPGLLEVSMRILSVAGVTLILLAMMVWKVFLPAMRKAMNEIENEKDIG